jgi:RND family efflux transporter MFP subunit
MLKTSRLLNRRVLIIGSLCVTTIGGALVFAQTRREGNAETAAAAKQQGGYLTSIAPSASCAAKSAASRDIRKQAVEVVTHSATLRLTGSLAADEKSEVGSNAAGIVSETCVNRGSVVKKGDLLVQLDPRDAQYALDEGENAVEELRVRLGLDEVKDFDISKFPEIEASRLALELAEHNFKRSEALMKQHAIAVEAFDQTATEYRSAIQRQQMVLHQAKQLYRSYRSAVTHLTTLRKALDDCSIRAPFDGWVAERNIAVGERVISLFPGAKLVTLLRIDPLRLSLTVPQQEMTQIKSGQTVTFQADAFPGRTFSGTVRYITPAVASDNRSVCVEAVVPNPEAVLRPGLFVTAELQLEEIRTELSVPQAAVCNRGDVAAVFVVRGGVIREQIVSALDAAAGRVRILSGLTPADVVITTPERVRDGDSAL